MLHPRSHGGITAVPPPRTEIVGAWQLLERAEAPAEILTRALAWCIAQYCNPRTSPFVPALGLEHSAFRRTLATVFPGFVPPPRWLEAQDQTVGDAGPLAEFQDLRTLLLEHCATPDARHNLVAHLVATACMGRDHLWQDLGLPERQALSSLLQEYFPALAIKNSGDMKWKKFFYKQLCEREGLHACKAPSCAACCDYAKCFAPEAGAAHFQLMPG